MAISTAIGLDRISRVVGYQLKKGVFSNNTPYLPQRIAILAEGNTANQSTMPITASEITNSQEAGNLFGFGSPIHTIMRILRPLSGDGVGGIPTVVYSQEEAPGAVAAERTITITGTPTSNATHYVRVNGRTSIDGSVYSYTVSTTDTPTTIAAKISSAINGVLSAPCACSSALGVVTAVAKWKGLTSDQLNIEIDVDGNDAGVTYVIASSVTGAGTPGITDALSQFGNEWNTIVINAYDEATFEALETFNGVPDDLVPTGRFEGRIMKPFVALWGSVLSNKTTLAAITDASARQSQVTNVLCPAPNSLGFTYEASANGAYLAAVIFNNTPHLDVNGRSYPDMPVPSDLNIGDFADYNNRDFLVKKGSSTVDLVAGKYVFQDFVTSYHPDGEIPPAFRFVRTLMIDFNIKFKYYLLEQIYVVDHAISTNDQIVSVEKVIKPKQWIQVISALADDLANIALIVDVAFMQSSIECDISNVNPDRLETFFRYKRSGYARISATTAEAGFNFGERI